MSIWTRWTVNRTVVTICEHIRLTTIKCTGQSTHTQFRMASRFLVQINQLVQRIEYNLFCMFRGGPPTMPGKVWYHDKIINWVGDANLITSQFFQIQTNSADSIIYEFSHHLFGLLPIYLLIHMFLLKLFSSMWCIPFEFAEHGWTNIRSILNQEPYWRRLILGSAKASSVTWETTQKENRICKRVQTKNDITPV